jgi:hypothetical protein
MGDIHEDSMYGLLASVVTNKHELIDHDGNMMPAKKLRCGTVMMSGCKQSTYGGLDFDTRTLIDSGESTRVRKRDKNPELVTATREGKKLMAALRVPRKTPFRAYTYGAVADANGEARGRYDINYMGPSACGRVNVFTTIFPLHYFNELLESQVHYVKNDEEMLKFNTYREGMVKIFRTTYDGITLDPEQQKKLNAFKRTMHDAGIYPSYLADTKEGSTGGVRGSRTKNFCKNECWHIRKCGILRPDGSIFEANITDYFNERDEKFPNSDATNVNLDLHSIHAPGYIENYRRVVDALFTAPEAHNEVGGVEDEI